MSGATGTGARGEAAENLQTSGEALVVALINRLALAARQQVDQLVDTFDDLREQGGAGLAALLSGAQSALAGRNPVLGAIKGGFAALTTPMKVAAVCALVLAAVLAPVLLVVVLLLLIVLGVVAAFRSDAQSA